MCGQCQCVVMISNLCRHIWGFPDVLYIAHIRVPTLFSTFFFENLRFDFRILTRMAYNAFATSCLVGRGSWYLYHPLGSMFLTIYTSEKSVPVKMRRETDLMFSLRLFSLRLLPYLRWTEWSRVVNFFPVPSGLTIRDIILGGRLNQQG